MARRRLNVRLIGIGVSVLAVGGGVGLLLRKHHRPGNPAQYILAADQAMQQQNYDLAATNYAAAADLLPQDTSLHVKLGKAYFMSYMARPVGSDAYQQAVTEFDRAAGIDPTSKAAWGGLLDTNEYNLERWDLQSPEMRSRENDKLPAIIASAQTAANHLAVLEPDNLDVRAEGPILALRSWLWNLSMPDSPADRDLPPDQRMTPEKKADQAIADLTKLMRDHPENEKLPYWIARAKIFQASQALQGEHPEYAPSLFSEAAAQFDPSIAAKPDAMPLYLKKAAILQQLQATDPSPTAAVDYRAQLRDTLDKAQALATPKNQSQYLIAKEQWAWVLSSSSPPEAERVYREIINQCPDEIGARLALARLLQTDPSRRPDALATLDAIPTLPGASVVNAQQRELWESNVARSKLVRADIETDQLSTTPQGKARENLAADIRASLNAATKLFGSTPELLRVRGRFELANGDPVAAVQTLTQAADTMSANGGAVDFKLLHDEASAYRAAGQTGKAIDLLETAMKEPVVANNAEMRTTLAQLHLENHDPDGAKPHIDWLAVRYPGDPRIIQLQISQLGAGGDPKAKHDLYLQLPEKTAADQQAKFQVARQINDTDEQIRLLSLMSQADPSNRDTVFALAVTLEQAKRKDEALKVLNDYKQLRPDDKATDVMISVANGNSRANVEEQEEPIIQAIPDPLERHLKMAQLRESQQRTDEQMVELQEAAKVAPDNVDVLQQIFIMHMNAGRFTQAEAMLPHLSDLNADTAHGLMLRCKLALARQDIPGALAASRQMTHDMPDFAGSWELYGEALAAQGQPDLACQQFLAALALQGTNLDASRKLIQCSVQQGKLDDAKTYIKQARTRYPDDPAYLEMQSQFEINWGDPETVLDDLNQALHSHPNDRRYYAMTADALLASMRARASKGDSDGASKYLAAAKDLFTDAVKRWPDDLRFSNGLAQMDLLNHDLPGAEDTLKAISQRPRWQDQPIPLILLARVYVGANKLDLAEAALKQAMTFNPNSVDARMVLCDCKILEKKYDEGIFALQPVISVFAAREKYTDLLLGLNRGAQAELELSDAIKADPTNTALINLQLHVYDQEQRYDQGLAAATAAIDKDNSNLEAYYWRGKFEASGSKPDYDAALKDLGFFRTSMPTNVKGRSMIAAVLDLKGDRDGAIHELEAAMSSAPQDRQIRLALLHDYLASEPPRTTDADRLLTQTLSLPTFAHDAQFESKAALVWAQKGQNDQALAAIRDVMQNAPDKSPFMSDYFTVLLITKNYQLMLDESDQYAQQPTTSWYVFKYRGEAKAAMGDYAGASSEYQTALDRCSIETGNTAAQQIVASITRSMTVDQNPSTGVQKALDLVLPRAQNSVAWKLIAVDLYVANHNLTDGLKLEESALALADQLPTSDKLHLLEQANGLYLTASPPQTDKAMAICQKILAINPNDLNALNDVACILSDMVVPPKPEEALNWSQHAYDIVTKAGEINPRILDTHGWILIQLGRVDEGIDVLDRGLDKMDFPEGHYHLAEGYLKKGYPEEAQRQLQQAFDIMNKSAQNAPADPVLKGKIDVALKQVDQLMKDKSPVSVGP